MSDESLEDTRARLLRERSEREKLLNPEEELQYKIDWIRFMSDDLSLPGEPMKNPIPSKSGTPWEDWHRRLETFDNGFCNLSKDEIDKLLIFAGLFSAALTAFVVEAFKWLDDPMGDTQTQVSVHVSNQIANSTNTVPYTPKPFKPSASVIRINICWFLSLVLSLGSVLLGIICLQWIREFQRDITHASYQVAIAVRQIRYEGLQRWHVARFVNAIPLLLQLSVILFFVGVFDLLLDRNPLVAYIVLVPMVFTVAILLITTILPTLQLLYHAFFVPRFDDHQLPSSQCPFKSPQSWLFQKAMVPVVAFGCRLWYKFSSTKDTVPHHIQEFPLADITQQNGTTGRSSASVIEAGLSTEHQQGTTSNTSSNRSDGRSLRRRFHRLPFLSYLFQRERNDTEDLPTTDTTQTSSRLADSLDKIGRADSWSALDEILHRNLALPGSADRYFCEAWSWSLQNVCQSKEAFFDLLLCYSELDARSVGRILDTQPDLDFKAMPDQEKNSRFRIRSSTAKEGYDKAIGLFTTQDNLEGHHRAVPAEMALLFYLTAKGAPGFVKEYVYPWTRELFFRLRHHSFGIYTSEIEVPTLMHIQQLDFANVDLFTSTIASLRDQDDSIIFFDPNSSFTINGIPLRNESLQRCLQGYIKLGMKEGTVNGISQEKRLETLKGVLETLLYRNTGPPSRVLRCRLHHRLCLRLGNVIWVDLLDLFDYHQSRVHGIKGWAFEDSHVPFKAFIRSWIWVL